jgi:hypothetical protein
MFKPLKHPFVKILGGLPVFIGQTGEIVDKEGKLYRVKLDAPVMVPNVGEVTNDLWEPAMLKVIKPGQKAKAVAIDAPVTAPATTRGRRADAKALSAKGEAQRRAGVRITDVADQAAAAALAAAEAQPVEAAADQPVVADAAPVTALEAAVQEVLADRDDSNLDPAEVEMELAQMLDDEAAAEATEVEMGLQQIMTGEEREEQPVPDTRTLDTAIAVLSDNGKVKRRKGRPDGKPKGIKVAKPKVDRGVIVRKAKKAKKGGR